MRYKVSFTSHAARTFRKLARETQLRLRPVVDILAQEPRPPGAEKLSGTVNTYRVRVGEYRILYDIRDEDLVLIVVGIGHRRDIYRQSL
jgi:mRNA interferase RelE/StbE